MLEIALPALVALLPFVILGIIYVLILHTPQGSKFTHLNPTLKVGNRVNTVSGIIGCVVKIKQKTFVLETYDGALLEMAFASATEIIS